MEGATEGQKATIVKNYLEALCVELIMPHFGSKHGTYLDTREAKFEKV